MRARTRKKRVNGKQSLEFKCCMYHIEQSGKLIF